MMNLYKYVSFCLLALVLVLLYSCKTSSPRHLTERLFLERKRINISHLGSLPGQGSSATGAVVLSEQVTYSEPVLPDQSDDSYPDRQGLDTNKIYRIPQVTVVSRARFAPVREGHVSIDFVIHVPKEFLSDDYQICLTPELFHNDSLVILDDVVLSGSKFVEKQQKDYQRYNEYVAGIVNPDGYDTMFVDRQNVERELNRRRKSELSSYYDRWVSVQDYFRWREQEQEKHDTYNIRQMSKLRNQLAKYDSDYRLSLSRMLASAQDTARLGREYRRKRRQLIASSSATHRKITLETVPAKYREYYRNGIKPDDIEPFLPGYDDSVRIASEHIMHERIAMNEIKGIRLDETFERMVPSPYRPDAHHNANISSDYDFVYRYSKDYPVTAGLKKLRLTLKGYITATDRSRYNVRGSDTLSFIISSIDELADGRLIANKDFNDTQRSEYTHALQLLRNREYARALAILNEYKDYNTALVLTCMGYNDRAYDLLRQLNKTGHTHYLGAILACRLDDYNRAIDHLKKAYHLDDSWSLRSDRDPEISKLIKTYGLQNELDEILYH